jgi:glycolate oxidase iron-sulfur subunit
MAQPTGGPEDALREEAAGLLACVHCGFCLNACPTYTRLGHEGDSPRGRLDLMRAVVEGRLPPDDPAFALHIDRCLGCRACEPVCPSGVPYGFLLERARTAIARASGVPLSARLLITSFTGPLRPAVGLVSRALRASGLAGVLARRLPRRLAAMRFALAMLAASRPWPELRSRGRAPATGVAREPASGRQHVGGADRDVAGHGHAADPHGDTARPAAGHGHVAGPGHGGTARPVAGPGHGGDHPGGTTEDLGADPERGFADPHALAGAYPAATAHVRHRTGPARPRVALLVGCVQRVLFERVNAATVRVLEANGYEVVAVPGQRCCGALDAHAGRLERAEVLARRNIEAFDAAGVDLVVVNAAGCGAILKEYGAQLRRDPAWAERAASFAARVRDVNELLAESAVRAGAPLGIRVTYDAPCHLQHGQRIRSAPLELLDGIPGVQRIPLPDADECCGGAGLYGLNHPELGGRILGDKVEAILATGAEVVATPNPGCMMQIGAGLVLRGEDVAVVHPIELLDESYRRAEEAD